MCRSHPSLRRRIGFARRVSAARYLARPSASTAERCGCAICCSVICCAFFGGFAHRGRGGTTYQRAGGAGMPDRAGDRVGQLASALRGGGGAPLLERFKRMAREAIGTHQPTIGCAGPGGRVAARRDPRRSLTDELDRVRPYAGAGRMRDAVARAVAAVEASGIASRQVAILTDGQRSTWNEPAPLRGDVHVLVWAPTTTPPANRAVVLADPRPLRWTPRGTLAARAMGPDSTTYRMALGQRTLARGTIVPNEEALVRRRRPNGAGRPDWWRSNRTSFDSTTRGTSRSGSDPLPRCA